MTRDSDFKRKVRERIAHTGEPYSAARAALLAREPAHLPDLSGLIDADRTYFLKTARSFFEGRRLRSIPLKRRARVVVLLVLVSWFEPGRRYPEAEVNQVLAEANEDVAFLRRELVEYGYLSRSGGVYWVSDTLPERDAQEAQEVPASEAEFLRRRWGARPES